MVMGKAKYKIHSKNIKKIMYKPIHKILVPIDCSKNSMRGIDYAISLAKSSGGTITGFYVKPSQDHVEHDVDDFFKESEIHAERRGIFLNNEISTGSAGPEIIDYATDHKFDLIVMGAKGFSKTKKIFFGSVSNYVLNSSKIPVMIVK